MKIEKKFAVILLDFIDDYLHFGYYPVDDNVNESALISKVLGFGVHHDLCDTDHATYWAEKRELPKVKKVARIDLTSDEGCAIMDMLSESVGKDIDDKPEYERLRKYLTKKVC